GYTPPEGSRKYFGALLVGYYGPEGLLFAGRVGTGFSERALETLYGGFQRIRRTMCPFVNLPERTRGRWGLGITPAVMRTCSWVEPVLAPEAKEHQEGEVSLVSLTRYERSPAAREAALKAHSHHYSGGFLAGFFRSWCPFVPDSALALRMAAFAQNQRARHPHCPFRSLLGVHSCYGLCAP